MKPAAFDYLRAASADEAVAALAEHGDDARILAGGQSLMAVLNMRLAAPALLIDISRCAPLAEVRVEAGAWCVGAAATQSQLEWHPDLAEQQPLLAEALPHVAHFQIRNRGTVCGSVAHADPSAELPLALVALGGEVVLRSRQGRRTLAADAFFTGMLTTACADDEMVEEVRFPRREPGTAYAFDEFALRHGDFAACAVAVVARADRLRIAVGGVGDRPVVRAWPGELDGADLDDALNDFAWSLDARDDPHVSAQMRRHLVRRLGRRGVERARSRRVRT